MKRVLAALAAAAALTLAATALVATPAQAAGGGCNWSDGFVDTDTCIGDNGVTVGGDVYIYSIWYKLSCYRATLFIEESSDGGNTWRRITDELNYPCRVGYIGPVEATMRPGKYYRTWVWFRFTNGWSEGKWSPIAW